jgi:hypothetical protein
MKLLLAIAVLVRLQLLGDTFGDDCLCGCSPEDHTNESGTVAGGPCANHWHCDGFQGPNVLGPSDIEDLNRIQPGSGDDWQENHRRFW